MKTSVISILVMLVFAIGNYGYCQKENTRSYKVWVKLKQKNSKIMGRLVELRDTTIVVQNWNDTIGLGILGGAVGSVIGSLKKNFVIDGILQNYTDIRSDLNKYVVQ